MMNEDYQVECLYGERAVAGLSHIEQEYMLTKIVRSCLGKRFFDQIGVEVFDLLVDEGLIDFKEKDDDDGKPIKVVSRYEYRDDIEK